MRISRRNVLQAIGGATAAPARATAPARRPSGMELFGFDGGANIREEDHFGIINGRASMGVNYRDIATLSGLFAPPYASSNFFLELRLYGDRVPTGAYRWYPTEVRRHGARRGIQVSSTTALAADQRAGVVEVTFANTTGESRTVPVAWNFTGSCDYVKFWGFPRPVTDKKATESAAEGRAVVRYNDAGAFAAACDLPELQWEPWSSHWVTRVRLAPGARRTFHLSFAIGARADSVAACQAILNDPAGSLARSRAAFEAQVKDLFAKLPSLEASHASLTSYYNRSLLHLLTNQWRVPEFVVNPCYSTGAMKGGCVGCYLWDYGLIPELLPLYDPEAVKAHIRRFLQIDITKHFLFNPMDGKADGPWYPANQHCILASIYHYVLATGDAAFLGERIGERTVLDLAVQQAAYGDDPSRPAVLMDYGKKVGHLELRRQYTYDQVLPDVNGQRYENFRIVAELARLAGKPYRQLEERMDPLRRLLKETLWSSEHRWFYYQSEEGGRQLRYTNIIYLLFGSHVLDREQEEGLLSHLNEDEFLSEYGLHSISKRDPAYDQVDIDHGGGGSYVAFPACIAESFYKAGYPRPAHDILRRTLWWAERLPFWGDSVVANLIDYRKDTPLQSDISGAAGAQAIIFGMLGVHIAADGRITVNPQPPEWSPRLRLTGFRARGRTLDITVDGGAYAVNAGGNVLRGRVGTPVVVA